MGGLVGAAVTYARRTDATHREVVDALVACGCSVAPWRNLAGCPDVVVGVPGTPGAWLVEIKQAKGKLRASQLQWQAAWRGGPVVVLRSADEAIAWVRQLRQGAA